jgi:Txe/YoeB family toxin of Txe-Axe toxin-antitoxin module
MAKRERDFIDDHFQFVTAGADKEKAKRIDKKMKEKIREIIKEKKEHQTK